MSHPPIALAGATGNLGLPILSTLLAANYPVTVLSRIGGTSSKLRPHPNLTIREVDFTSVPSLTAALQDPTPQVVISCLATLAMGSQNPFIDASVAAGVKRFIPAEFGMDSLNPLSVQLPVCAPKAATQRYLSEKARLHPSFSWTAIANGLFLDWCLEAGIILDVKNRAATLYNGGDVPFSATLLKDIARAVVGVIERQDETRNRVVYVHSAVVTQNQLIKYAKEKDGRSWDVVGKETEEVRRESLAELSKEADVDAAMLGFSIVGCLDTEYGCDFSGRLDNELLGVRVLSEDEVRGVVQGFCD
ncbi:hypothetical protein BDW62DRAFT_219450 [Aspergillus aurantiobrunneus]